MSDEEKNIEQIRELLRKKLEAGAAADGWNVPSGHVWTGLSEELAAGRQARRSSRRSYWLGAAIATLLAVLLLRECGHQSQLAGLKSDYGQLKGAYENLQKNCDEKQSSTQGGATHDVPQTIAPGQAPLHAVPPASRGFGLRPKTAEPPGQAVFFDEKNVAATEQAQVGPLVFSPDSIHEPFSFLRENTPSPPLLPALPTTFFENESPGPNPRLHLPESPSSHAGIPFIASVYGGLALTGNRLTGEKPAIIARQKALMGWQTGVGLAAVFSRQWSLEAGLRYSVSRVQTDYQLAVPFTHANEYQHDDGNFDNQYNHSLPSSLGNYPAQFILTRESTTTVEEGEVMNLDLSIRQQTNLLSLPLHLRYGFGKHRWQAGLRAGMVANRTLSVAAEDAPELVSHHGAIHQRHTSIGNPSVADLQKMTLDASLGLDLRYQILPRLGLSLESAWQQGLTPIYKGDRVKNYLRAGSLGLGVQYWIR